MAKLALRVKKLALKLIFFIELDRFAILLLILSSLMPSSLSIPGSFLSFPIYNSLAETNKTIGFSINLSKAVILLKT